jgi:hypothetical protein
MDKFLIKEFECRRSGTELYFCCPFCKDDKGFNYWFDVEKSFKHKTNGKEYVGLGRCWKCEKRNTVLSFIMEYKKLDLFAGLSYIEGEKNLTVESILKQIRSIDDNNKDSIDILMKEYSDLVSFDLPPHSTKDLPKELSDWFVKVRSFPKELLDWLDVRYCQDPYKIWKYNQNKIDLRFLKYRAIFPITTNKAKGWQAYLFKPGIVNPITGEKVPKTRNPPGPVMHNLLFCYEFSKNNPIIICHEGIFDTLRTITRDFSAVGLMGKNLSHTQAFMLGKTKAKEICMGLDGGEREEIQTLKNCLILEEFCDSEITFIKLPHGIDPDDCPHKSFIRCFKNRIHFNSRNVIYDGKGKISGYNG